MNSSVDNLISLSDSGVGSCLSTTANNLTREPEQVENRNVDDVFEYNFDPARRESETTSDGDNKNAPPEENGNMDDFFGLGLVSVAEGAIGKSKTTGSIEIAPPEEQGGNMDDFFGFGLGPMAGCDIGESKTTGSVNSAPPEEDVNMDDFFGLNSVIPVRGGAIGEGKTNGGNENASTQENNGNGLLVDLTDAVQIPVPQGILLQAECDDTFGIFSSQQSSQGSNGTGKETLENEGEDDASKLVRSFTSGRKSITVKMKKKDETEKLEGEKKDDSNEDLEDKNDSCDSFGSDQPTIIGSDCGHSPKLPDIEDGEKGVMEQKMNLTSGSNTSNFSGGSDSEILDVDNLSSFSIPDDDNDENKFIEDIKRKDMAMSSVTAAVVNEIKLQVLQEEDGEGDEVEYYNSLFAGSSNLSTRLKEHGLLSEISRPSVASAACTTLSDRLSTASTVSRSSRLSTSSQNGNFFGDRDVPNVAESTHITGASDSDNGIVPSISNITSTRSRLSSSNFGSPIRASYPLSNRFFMPTPKAKTPSAANRDFYDYHDRLSESLLSPSRTRVMLITGDSHRSPNRAPVRKSISAETLHYEYNSPSARSKQRHSIKFSTPSASQKRSRNSVSFSAQSGYQNLNLFGDDLPGIPERQQNNPHMYNAGGGHSVQINKPEFMQHRGRLSYASSVSNSSINTLSPPGNSTYCRFSEKEESLVGQLNRIQLTDASNMGIVQPVRATAVIAPTTKPAIKSSATGISNKTGIVTLAKPKLVIQQPQSRPITASSPSTTLGRPGSNQITPTRGKPYPGIRSSGYGKQQNLNDTFGTTQPLKSPNKATTSTAASIKPPAIPKSIKAGVSSIGSKLELGTRGGGTTATRTGVTALKPGGKLPAPSSTTGIRRPVAASTAPSAATGGNKENKLRPSTAPSTTRFGLRPHRQ